MVELSILGDCSAEDLLREVVCTDVSTDGNGVPSKSVNFLNDKLSFLFVKAAVTEVSINLATSKQYKRTN